VRERPPVQIRVGLNSGEVVVHAIGSDLDYTAVGQTTHFAARMEQLAGIGSLHLLADHVEKRPRLRRQGRKTRPRAR
jgi:class 3 adenylate cyclase